MISIYGISKASLPFALQPHSHHCWFASLPALQDCSCFTGRTALHLAVLAGSVKTTTALCKRSDVFDINLWDNGGLTALHLAASLAAVDLVDILLATPGIDLLAGSTPETPMHCACSANADAEPLNAVRRLGQEWQRKKEGIPGLCAWLGCLEEGAVRERHHANVCLVLPVLTLSMQSIYQRQCVANALTMQTRSM
jgi:hypothetical protein